MHVFYPFPHSCFPSCCASSRVESSEEARFSRPFECGIAQHLYLIFERKHAESLPPSPSAKPLPSIYTSQSYTLSLRFNQHTNKKPRVIFPHVLNQ